MKEIKIWVKEEMVNELEKELREKEIIFIKQGRMFEINFISFAKLRGKYELCILNKDNEIKTEIIKMTNITDFVV